MAKTYRLGVIGFAHMHINELMRTFAEVPNVEWVACADTRPARPELVEARFTRDWNKRHAHETIGIPRVYDDYREMLDNERFDLVLFCPENSRHGEVARGDRRPRRPPADREADGGHPARGAAHGPRRPRRGAHAGGQLADHLVARGAHGAPPGARGRHRAASGR